MPNPSIARAAGAIQSMVTHRVGFVHYHLSKSFEFHERLIHGTNQSARGLGGRWDSGGSWRESVRAERISLRDTVAQCMSPGYAAPRFIMRRQALT